MRRAVNALRWILAGVLFAAGLTLFPRLSGGPLLLSALFFLPGRRPLLRLIPAVLLLAASVLVLPNPDMQLVEPIATVEHAAVATPAAHSVSAEPDYVLNLSSKKFHYPDCSSVSIMKPENRQNFYGSQDEAVAAGYDPCGRCKP